MRHAHASQPRLDASIGTALAHTLARADTAIAIGSGWIIDALIVDALIVDRSCVELVLPARADRMRIVISRILCTRHARTHAGHQRQSHAAGIMCTTAYAYRGC